MQLPEDYNAGPMSLQEFNDLKSDEESEASRHGYIVKVARVDQDGHILAKVTYSEELIQNAGTLRDAGANSVAGAAVAAIGAGVGAAVGGPLGAAAGAAAATALAAGIAGAAGSVSSSKRSIANALQEAAKKFDVDPKLLAAIAAVESSFDPTAKNPRSTAFGLFQFLDGTWKGVVRQFGATIGVEESDRADVTAQCLMGAAFLRDNKNFLARRLGREPTNGDCYAAHFLGATTAAQLLSGSGDISAADALGARAQAVIAANPDIFKRGNAIRTVNEVAAELSRRVNAATARGEQLLGAG